MNIFPGYFQTPTDILKPTRRVFYGWWLVGVAAFMLTLMALTVFQGIRTLLVALESQFDWSRTTLDSQRT